MENKENLVQQAQESLQQQAQNGPTPEEIAAAKEFLASKRDEVMESIESKKVDEEANTDYIDYDEIKSFKKERVHKYMDSLIKVWVTLPHQIKINQKMIDHYEEAMESMDEDDNQYQAIRANRMATINQIHQTKQQIADYEDQKEVYEEILSQLFALERLLGKSK